MFKLAKWEILDFKLALKIVIILLTESFTLHIGTL